MINKSIEINNISKEYITGIINYKNFIDDLKSKLKKDKETSFQKEKKILALNNINLSINKSEKIGLIGKNGSGKSTLLKIISDITRPTSGEVKIMGSLSSLIEVSAGFHEEMSGLENIYLKGALLGFDKNQIEKKLEEICHFSEIDTKYLHTPTKKYSSGMTVKLAFAINVSLPTEIMIFDEILAVGDENFRKKSVKKLNELSNSDTTIMFVSHNMDLIKNICEKCIFLNNGEVVYFGETEEAIKRYLKQGSEN